MRKGAWSCVMAISLLPVGRAHRGLHGDRPPGTEPVRTPQPAPPARGRSAAEDGGRRAILFRDAKPGSSPAAENSRRPPLRAGSGARPWQIARSGRPPARPFRPARAGPRDDRPPSSVPAPTPSERRASRGAAASRLRREKRRHIGRHELVRRDAPSTPRAEPAEVVVEVATHRHEIADLDARGCAAFVQPFGGHAAGGIVVAGDVEAAPASARGREPRDDWPTARRSWAGRAARI